VDLQEAPHLQNSKQHHSENSKAEVPKRNFSLSSNPLVFFRRIFNGYVLSSEGQ
jgi:hypothetical protein